MNKRKGFFRLTLILSFLCGIFALYFPNDVFEDPAFRNGNVKITLPSDWGGKSVQEKLDLINNLDIKLGDWEEKREQERRKQRKFEREMRKEYGLEFGHTSGFSSEVGIDELLLFYFNLSPREKQNVKEKLKEEIISGEKFIPMDKEKREYWVSLGPDYTKISLLILAAFTIGFALVWIIYAVIRWVVIGFIAGGFKDRSTP